MTANVVKATQVTGFITHQQQRLIRDLGGEIIARLCQLIVPAHKLPGAREDPLLFFKKSPAIEIKFCGQRPGMGEIRLDLQD